MLTIVDYLRATAFSMKCKNDEIYCTASTPTVVFTEYIPPESITIVFDINELNYDNNN